MIAETSAGKIRTASFTVTTDAQDDSNEHLASIIRQALSRFGIEMVLVEFISNGEREGES